MFYILMKKQGKFFFTGGGKEKGNPYHVYLYKVNFDGSGLVCLTPEKGTHTIYAANDWKHLLLHFLLQKMRQSHY